jgi:hypothetical protein
VSTAKHLRQKREEQDPAKRRATAVQETFRMARMYQEGSPARFRIESLAMALNSVRKDPRFTGAQKDAKFRSLLNRAR